MAGLHFALPLHSSIPSAGRLQMIWKSKGGEILAGWAEATGGDGTEGGGHVGSLIDRLMAKGVRAGGKK